MPKISKVSADERMLEALDYALNAVIKNVAHMLRNFDELDISERVQAYMMTHLATELEIGKSGPQGDDWGELSVEIAEMFRKGLPRKPRGDVSFEIAELLSGKEWDADTCTSVAEALERAGYLIKEPR